MIQALIESFDLTEAEIVGERTVRQRIIVAGTSQNRNHYPAAVLQKSASLFEGVQTFRDHVVPSPGKKSYGRSTGDLTGWLTDIQFKEGALWGMRHFTRNQAGADNWALVEDILSGRAPSTLFGVSINAGGRGRREKRDDGDIFMVESIDIVQSVDDVTTPSAGGGFMLEGMDGVSLTQELLKLMDYQEWREARTDYVGRLKNEWQSVQQTDAIKTAKAEADRLVKAARTESERVNAALAEAQAQLDEQRGEIERLRGDSNLARLRLAVIDVLEGTQLPVKMQRKLRTQLWEADPSRWTQMIEQAIEMLALAGNGAARVPVRGAGQQIAPSPAPVTPPRGVQPLDMSRIETPEQLAEALEQIQRSTSS